MMHLSYQQLWPVALWLTQAIYSLYHSFQQLWIVVLCLTQPMAELVTHMEQHTEIQQPTDVIQAIPWMAAALEDVPLQEGGLGVNLPVKVCCYFI